MTEDLTQEEVRFAVVLNGGVSLAVWMGGVVLELDHLTRRTGAYEHLLGLVGASARADVISGTSAGGINGAALALAQVNPQADLSNLRELWAEQGRMDLLLRTPFKGAPVSLLKGDEFFLPRLEDAMRRLTTRYAPRTADDRPIDLRVTTTLLQGKTRTTTDALGQRLTQNIHQGIFQFTRQGDRDDFRTDDGHLPPKLTQQLALAARSSASFPVAFEPSFVDVGKTSTVKEIANWWDAEVDHSQFAVDGGVLVNTPTKEALEAIDRMPAEGPTRRIMLLVFPHATTTADPPAQTKADQPSVVDTVRSIMRAQSSQSNRTFVDEIEAYNRGAAARRGGRNALLKSLAAKQGKPLPQRLYELIETLYPHYSDIRLRRAARRLAERQIFARAKLPEKSDAAWSFERIRDAVELAHLKWRDEHDSLPYVPKVCPPAGISEHDQGWPWDIATGERLAASALDMLKRVVWVMPDEDELRDVHTARGKVHAARARLRTMREQMHAAWESDAMTSPDTDCWFDRLAKYDKQMKGAEGNLVRGYILDVARAFDIGAAALSTADSKMMDRDPSLVAWRQFIELSPDDPDATMPQPYRSLSRLLALEVATTCLADDSESPEEQQVDLAQISLHTENSFARYSIEPDDKAGGYSLSRFSGFLKRSWRANDWTWGRMDAASMLCRVMLDPTRVRRTADLAGLLQQVQGTEEERLDSARPVATKIVNELVANLFGEPPTDNDIVACWNSAIEEVAKVYAAEPGEALPATCEALADLVAWALHVEIILEELPEVRRAILADGVDGASTRSNSERFVKQYASLVDDIEHLPARKKLDAQTVDLGLKALVAFDRAGIGREPLGEEAASDQMIRTAATAAATAITVVDSDKLGVKAARPVTRSLRGLVLLPYWTILGLTRGGQLARFLGQFGLAAGGLLLVLAVLGALPDWAETPGAAVGAGALLAAFGYSALRTGSMLHGLVLLSPGVTMVTYGVTETTKATGRGMAGLVGIVLFVVALLLIGSLPGATLTPMGGLAKLRRNFVPWLRSKHWIGPLAGLLIIAACAGIVLSGVLGFFNHNQVLVVIGAGVVVLIAAVLSYFSGRTLRIWQQVPGQQTWTDPPTQDPAASAATWAVVYGAGYVAAAVGLSFVAPETPFSSVWWSAAPWWAMAAMATAIAFAAVLLLVVPWYVPWRARAVARRKLIDEANPAIYKEADCVSAQTVEAKLCQRLTTQGMVNRHLARCPAKGGLFDLTPAGVRIAAAIKAKMSA